MTSATQTDFALIDQVARRRLQLGGVGGGVGRVLGRPRLGIEIQREIQRDLVEASVQLGKLLLV